MYMIDCLRRLAGDLAPCGPTCTAKIPSHSVIELELVAADGAGLGQRFLACFYTLIF